MEGDVAEETGTVVVNVDEVLDQAPFGPLQRRVIALCALIALLDGFDTQAIAFVAPVLAAEWNVGLGVLGPVFGAGLAGLMIGALTLGSASDRMGRKTILLVSTLLFGVFALATAGSWSLQSLIVLRFLTGIGLGAAMPNIIALTSEYMPSRVRATAISVMFCGFPLGAVLGGLLATWLIPVYGWRSVFWIGGSLPLVVLPLLFWLLPESVRFLAARRSSRASHARIAGTLKDAMPGAAVSSRPRFDLGEPPAKEIPVVRLFREGRAASTLLLWVVFFTSLLLLYFLVNWLPALLRRAGLPIEHAIIATVVLNAGGIVGAILLARFVDRVGPRSVLTVAYAAAAVFTALLGPLSDAGRIPLLVGVFFAGFGVIGGQICMNALAAAIYPTAMRATGVGWALGIGRLGSVLGPVAGGILLAEGLDTGSIFLVAAGTAVVATLAVAALKPAASLSTADLSAIDGTLRVAD